MQRAAGRRCGCRLPSRRRRVDQDGLHRRSALRRCALRACPALVCNFLSALTFKRNLACVEHQRVFHRVGLRGRRRVVVVGDVAVEDVEWRVPRL